uniref:Uncharacterized protein n=1 Tax=Romanomermis culicivorax TaxID=13658 RepID=A0A915K5T2_ROMCU
MKGQTKECRTIGDLVLKLAIAAFILHGTATVTASVTNRISVHVKSRSDERCNKRIKSSPPGKKLSIGRRLSVGLEFRPEKNTSAIRCENRTSIESLAFFTEKPTSGPGDEISGVVDMVILAKKGTRPKIPWSKSWLPRHMASYLIKFIYLAMGSQSSMYIIHREVYIEIFDRKIPNTFNKYLLCALNPALTQET